MIISLQPIGKKFFLDALSIGMTQRMIPDGTKTIFSSAQSFQEENQIVIRD